MEEGWIKLHRRFLDWEWFDCDGMVRLFVAILLMSNHEDQKWHGKIISRGQVLTSREKLCAATGLSARQVRTCLGRLEQTGEIIKKSTNKNTIITICKYDDYQVKEESQRPTNDQQTTNKRPTNDQPTNKNEKNIYITKLPNAPAHTREDWRYISSVRRSTLNNDPDRIADLKRSLFRAEVNSLANELGMTSQQVEAFCRYWSESSPRSERIKADFEITFDTRSRMQNWIERDRPRANATKPAKSRMDQYEEDMRFINDFFNGQQQDSTADEQ